MADLSTKDYKRFVGGIKEQYNNLLTEKETQLKNVEEDDKKLHDNICCKWAEYDMFCELYGITSQKAENVSDEIGKLPIYLYGQSMGAAAVLMASGYRLPSEVKGLIADCGFQSMERQMRDMADNWFHLHYIPLLLKEMDCLCHFVAGFRMKDADTTEAMKRNTRPVLFFHGEKDTYVYPNNSFQNYMLCKAPKELVIVQGARHLCSAYADPELYQRTVMEFFEKYDGSNSEK